ncbi:hypothetical protein sos41_40270 [Alphaproteobacteria bacterium SO-S41]|nr:hypothetical protein sos41_40270 [Alphaproteobacteria bacterium SO-S41]
MDLLLKAIPEVGAGLGLQRQLGQLRDQVLVGAAPHVGRHVQGIHLRIDRAERRAKGKPGTGRHYVSHEDRTIERHELTVLHDLKVGKFRDKLRNGIVELPLAFFVELKHGHRDDRLGHRGDPEDRVLPHGFAAVLCSIILAQPAWVMKVLKPQLAERRLVGSKPIGDDAFRFHGLVSRKLFQKPKRGCGAPAPLHYRVEDDAFVPPREPALACN